MSAPEISAAHADEAESRFRALADAAPVMIWMTGADGRVEWVNRPWLEFTGHALEQELERDLLDAVHPADQARCRDLLRSAFERHEPYRVEYRSTRHDGAVRWILDHGAPRPGADGAAGGYMGTRVDITDRRAAEEAVLESEDRLATLFHQVAIGIVQLDPAGTITLANERFADMLGLDRDDLAGRRFTDLVDPRDRARVARQIETVLHDGRSAIVEHRCVADVEIWTTTALSLVRSIAGEPRAIVGVVSETTGQKLADEARRATEEILRTLCDNAPVLIGVAEIVGDGIVHLYDSPATARLLGLPPGATASRSQRDLGIPDDVIRLWIQSATASAERAEAVTFTYPHPTPRGQRIIAATVAAVAPGPASRPRFVYVASDITDQQRAEAAVRESEQRLRLALQAGRMFAFEWNTASDEIVRSDTSADILGPLAARETGHLFRRRIHAADRAALEAAFAGLHPDRPAYRVTCRVARDDGATVVLENAGTATFDDQRRVARVVGISVDVTERALAQEAARETEERFKFLAESLPTIVWAARPDGVSDYNNSRLYEYCGLPRDEMRRLGWAYFRHPDDRERASNTWSHAVSHGTPYECEYRLRRHDGVYRWQLARAVPMYGDDGRVMRWFGSVTDIDDQKQAQERLTRLVESLNRSNRELEDFAHIASHDLKEPLRGIRNYAAFLLEDHAALLPDEGRRRLAMIDTLARRMSDLIGSLLEFSRVGRAELAFRRTEIGALVAEAVAFLEPVLAERGAEVRILGPLPTIVCDTVRMGEVFRNLITNAVKYNRSETPRIEIGTMPHADPESTPVLFVRDNGIGIAPEHHDVIFRIFKRLHARDDYGGGTGCGLAFAKKIIERHHGRIWLESTPGKGTTFFFRLQREPRDDLTPAPAAH